MMVSEMIVIPIGLSMTLATIGGIKCTGNSKPSIVNIVIINDDGILLADFRSENRNAIL